MLPIIINPLDMRFALIGSGIASSRRLQMLIEHNVKMPVVFAPKPDDDFLAATEKYKQHIEFRNHLPSQQDLQDFNIVYIADFDDKISATLYEKCKKANILVNVEDKINFCDFHVPSIIKRGNMLITASTGGKSPALARALRKDLEARYNEDWAEKLDKLARKRQRWKKQNIGIDKLSELSNHYMKKNQWFI